MSDESVQILFGGDASGVVKATKETKVAVADATQAINATTESLNATTESLNKVTVASKKATDEFKYFTTSFTTMKQATGEINPAFNNVSEGFQKLAATTRTTANAFNSFRPNISAFNSVSNALKDVETAAHGAHGGTAGFYREVVVLGHEMISGNFSRIPGSMMVMAERSGKLVEIFGFLGSLMTPLNIGIGVVVASMAILGEKANETAGELAKVRVQMTAVGNRDVFDAKIVEEYIDSLSTLSGISKEAAVNSLAILGSTIHMTQDQFRQAAEMLPDVAAKFGDVGKAAQFLKETMDDPIRAAQTMQSTFNNLSAEEYISIQRMEALGDKTGATKVVMEALERATKGLHDDGLTPLSAIIETVEKGFDRLLKKAGELRLGFSSLGREVKGSDTGGSEADGGKNAGKASAEQKKLNEDIIKGIDLEKSSGLETSKRVELEGKILQLKNAQNAASKLGLTDKAADFGKDIAEMEKQLASVGKSAGGRSQVSSWQADLDKRLSAEKVFGEKAKAEELRYWQQKLAVVKQGSQEYDEITRKIYEMQSSAYDQDVTKFKEAERKKTQEAKQAAEKEIAFTLAKFDRMEAEAKGDFKKIQILENQKLAFLKLTYGKDSAQYQAEWKRKLSMDQQNLEQQRAKFTSFFSSVASTFTSSIKGMITGTQTFGQALGDVFMGIGEAILGVLEEIAVKWLVTQLIGEQTAATGARVAIGADAARAGAAAFASIAAIPIVGPAMAPAAAAAAYGGAMAFQASVPGFEVGAFKINSDMIAKVHKGETIMPAKAAEAWREGQGGGGGEVHLHVHAIDRRGVEKWFNSNGAAIAKTLKGQMRNGNPDISGMRA